MWYSLDNVFYTTKAFLAQGAHINYPINWTTKPISFYDTKEIDTLGFYQKLEFTSTAMFWLQARFNEYPEFRDFAEDVKGQVKMPLREIASIKHILTGDRAYPDKKESEMLWPLIEKWEETGQGCDADALQTALGKIWEAHKPEDHV
ncbi:MAG: hypothetical protein Q9167_002422 [Letrouitia subvulpina]